MTAARSPERDAATALEPDGFGGAVAGNQQRIATVARITVGAATESPIRVAFPRDPS